MRVVRKLAGAFPVALQFLAIGLFGWLDSMEMWFGERPGLNGWPRPDWLVAMAPFLLGSLFTIDAQARRTGPGWRDFRSLQARLFLTALGPFVAYILIAAGVGRVEILSLGIGRVSLWSFGFSGLIVLVFALGLPLFLRTTWNTQPMAPGPHRALLAQVAELASFRCRELLVWRTGHLMANAAIVGLTPGSRRVFFTDELLARMGPRQLAAVYAHEIGHAKRHHVAIFLTWSLAVFAGLDWGLTFVENGAWAEVAAWTEGAEPFISYLVLGLGLVLWLVGFGWLSRRIELEADLFSFELLQDTAGIMSALHAVGGGNPERHSWRHFSTAKRIEFLGRVEANPLVGIRLHRTIRNAALVGLFCAVLGGGARIATFVERYPVERASLDLGLGRFASALLRLEDEGGDEAAEMVQLARLAQSEGLGANQSLSETRAGVAERAIRDLRSGDLEQAIGWLTLAALSGDDSAAIAAEWLMGRLREDSVVLPAPQSAGDWRPALLEAEAQIDPPTGGS